MAKVIRSRYVFRPHNRWHRYLPRRNDGMNKEFDYEANNAAPSQFPDPITEPPSKLWLAWLYKDPTKEIKWTRQYVKNLFGENPEAGKMHIFKNTAAINRELWKIKHMIELRPVSFPNGEPTEADIGHIEVHPDGRCVIDRNLSTADEEKIKLLEANKQFTPKQLSRNLQYRYHNFKDVYQDTVYNPKNISISD
jgi:large subunit ribosomal protein L30